MATTLGVVDPYAAPTTSTTTQKAATTATPTTNVLPAQSGVQTLSNFTGTPQNQTPTPATTMDPLAFAPTSSPVQTQTMQQVINAASPGLQPILQQIDTLPYAYQDFFPGVDLSQ